MKDDILGVIEAVRRKERVRSVIAAALMLVFVGVAIFMWHGSITRSSHGVEFSTVFNRGYRLEPGSKVLLSDVLVGAVTAVELRRDAQVVVKFNVKEQYASFVTSGTTVTVTMDNPLQNVVMLIPDTSSSRATDGEVLTSREGRDFLTEAYAAVEKLQQDIAEIAENTKTVTRGMADPEGDWAHFQRSMRRTGGNLEASSDLIHSGLHNRSSAAGLVFNDPAMAILLDESLQDVRVASHNIATVSDSAVTTWATIDSQVQRIPRVMDNVESSTAKAASLVERVEGSWLFGLFGGEKREAAPTSYR